GYFRFPGTLVFKPDSDYASFTLNVTLTERDRAFPAELDTPRRGDADTSDSGRTTSNSRGPPDEEPSFFDKLAELAAKAAVDTLKETVENAVEHAGDTAPTPQPSPSPVASAPPPAERELHAYLFGTEIMRRPFSGSPWIEVKSGDYVDVFYEVEGLASSDLFDAPTQREADDRDVDAALAER